MLLPASVNSSFVAMLSPEVSTAPNESRALPLTWAPMRMMKSLKSTGFASTVVVVTVVVVTVTSGGGAGAGAGAPLSPTE